LIIKFCLFVNYSNFKFKVMMNKKSLLIRPILFFSSQVLAKIDCSVQEASIQTNSEKVLHKKLLLIK